MRDKLEKIIKAYEELEKKLSDPAVASDIKEFTRLNKEYAHQSDLIAASREYIGALDDIEAAKEMLHDTTDADEKEMLQMDISENEAKLPQLEEDIKYMLIPSDPTTTRTPSSRSAPPPVATRRPSSPATCTRCISAFVSRAAGRLPCSTPAPARPVALSPLSSRSRATASTPS